MKASKELKRLVKKLDLLADQISYELDEMVSDREYEFESKSNRWQEGEYGERYVEKSEELNDIQDKVIRNLNELFIALQEFDNI